MSRDFSPYLVLLYLCISSALCVTHSAYASSLSISKIDLQVTLSNEHKTPFICAKYKNTWLSGHIRRKRFIRDSDVIKSLTSSLKSIKNGTQRKKITRKISTLKKQRTTCISLGSSRPSAFPRSYTGRGITPLPILLSGVSGLLPSPIRCTISSLSSSLLLLAFDSSTCTALIQPKDHRTPQGTLYFTVERILDKAVSIPSPITLHWDQSESFIGEPSALTPYRDTLTEEEARYVARWLMLGGTSDQMVALAMQPGGYTKFLDTLFSVQSCPEISSAAQDFAVRARSRVEFVKAVYDAENRIILVTYYSPDDAQGRIGETTRSAALEWMYHLRFGCNPLKESYALFLQSHFPINLEEFNGGVKSYIRPHVALLRSTDARNEGKSLTPFSSLVSAMHGADGAMLKWLNNDLNERSTFGNENYARELLELFLLGPSDPITGARNYEEHDVHQLSYSLMGYREEMRSEGFTRTICCVPNANDSTNVCGKIPQAPLCIEKEFSYTQPYFDNARWNHSTRPDPQFLFQQFPFGRFAPFKANTLSPGEDTLTPYLLYEHPGVARYIATRLIASYSSISPTDGMVQEVAKLLIAHRYDIAPVLRTLLSSSAFFSDSSRYDCVASPIEHFTGLIRTLNLPSPTTPLTLGGISLYEYALDAAYRSGEAFLRPPSVFGYQSCGKITGNVIHKGTSWLSAQTALERYNGIVGILSQVALTLRGDWSSVVPNELMLARSPERLLSWIAGRLSITLTPEEHALLMEYLTHGSIATSSSMKVLPIDWTALSDTQYSALLGLKVPGLIEILATSPKGYVK